MTTNSIGEPVVRQTRARAPVETVYSLWVEPEKLLRWMGVSADLDPRPGGTFRINVTGRDVAVGEYTAVEAGSRLAFTWGWEAPGHPIPPGSSSVEVTFTQEGEITIVRVAHSGLPASEKMNTAYGWQHYLTRLGMAAIGRESGPDPWVVPEAHGSTAPS